MQRRTQSRERDWLFTSESECEFSYLDFQEDSDDFTSFFRSLEATIRQHFGHEGELDHSEMAHNLWHHSVRAFENVWSRSDVEADLRKLRRDLIEAAHILKRLPDRVSDEFRLAAVAPLVTSQNTDLGWGVKLSPRSFTNTMPEWKAFLALREFEERVDDIVPLLDACIDVAKCGEPQGNKAIEEWRVVDACVALCERHTEVIRVPRRMNNAGPFYRFLRDVFDVFQLDGDPVSAFRGWRRFVDRTSQTNL